MKLLNQQILTKEHDKMVVVALAELKVDEPIRRVGTTAFVM